MKYRLLSHNKNLVVLHGRPHEKSSLFDMIEMYSLSEQFQNDETRKKYLSKNKCTMFFQFVNINDTLFINNFVFY